MIPINNTFEVDTHPGVTIINPEIEVIQTIDKPQDKVFIPCVIIHAPNIKIYHILSPQPYVNGTWEDEDVQVSIINYFTEL